MVQTRVIIWVFKEIINLGIIWENSIFSIYYFVEGVSEVVETLPAGL